MKTILILIASIACLALRADNVGPTVTILRTNVAQKVVSFRVVTTTVNKLNVTPVTINGKTTYVTNVVGVVSENSVTNALKGRSPFARE